MAMTSSDTDFDLERVCLISSDLTLFQNQLHVVQWDHLNLYKFYPLALATSWSVRCMLYPMSVVKSRLQLQKQSNVYRGMTHAFTSILKNEGIGALYRVSHSLMKNKFITQLFQGFWVTLPQLSASFIYSSVYEKLRNVLVANTSITSDQIVSALAGGSASVW
jgi:solute carrier family 25 protein 44